MVKVGEPDTAGNAYHSFLVITCCSIVGIITNKMSRSSRKSFAKPHFVLFNQREYLFISNCILISYHQELLLSFYNPREELSKEGERRIGDDDVGFIAQGGNLRAAEVPIALQILPLQVVDVYPTIVVRVVRQCEDFTLYAALLHIVQRIFGLEERGLSIGFVLLAFDGV